MKSATGRVSARERLCRLEKRVRAGLARMRDATECLDLIRVRLDDHAGALRRHEQAWDGITRRMKAVRLTDLDGSVADLKLSGFPRIADVVREVERARAVAAAIPTAKELEDLTPRLEARTRARRGRVLSAQAALALARREDAHE